jgi:hypothetical protein
MIAYFLKDFSALREDIAINTSFHFDFHLLNLLFVDRKFSYVEKFFEIFYRPDKCSLLLTKRVIN